jgi:hypothetical protein
MTLQTNGNGSPQHNVQKQLRDLNNEYRETTSALMGAQVSINRTLKLQEQNYHRRRKEILNAHGQDEDRI